MGQPEESKVVGSLEGDQGKVGGGGGKVRWGMVCGG